MPQLRLTVSERNAAWLGHAAEDIERLVFEAGGSSLVERAFGSVNIYIEFPARSGKNVVAGIKNALTEIYCVRAKREYLSGRLRLPMLRGFALELFIRTLIAFDRESDAELVGKKLRLYPTFSVDGFFTFRLGELVGRWSEIARLTEDNAALLYDERATSLLQRFFLSAVAPREESVSVREESDGYLLKSGGNRRLLGPRELLLTLVDIAPVEIVLENEVRDAALKERLENMFDVKSRPKNILREEIPH